MKNMLMPIMDKIMLLKRALIESVIGKLKFLDKLEHSRHRSVTNAFSHMISCLINYQLQDRKPSIKNLLPKKLFITKTNWQLALINKTFFLLLFLYTYL
ncbi:transposase [Candidatus Tisiphia endosymbiont of Ptychoptera albimana]|uniref:transposase n=1 Tax=Candidatus Tisiphia endosymbiont of Ptychoptera albimana TaxID=3066260 RepID=UPI00312C93DA